jgi:hypothetical protein
MAAEINRSSGNIELNQRLSNDDQDQTNEDKKLKAFAAQFFNILLPVLLIPATVTYFIFSLITTGELEFCVLSSGVIGGLFACSIGQCLKV